MYQCIKSDLVSRYIHRDNDESKDNILEWFKKFKKRIIHIILHARIIKNEWNYKIIELIITPREQVHIRLLFSN